MGLELPARVSTLTSFFVLNGLFRIVLLFYTTEAQLFYTQYHIPYTLTTFSEGFGGTGGRDRVDPVHGSNTDASARQPTSGCDV